MSACELHKHDSRLCIAFLHHALKIFFDLIWVCFAVQFIRIMDYALLLAYAVIELALNLLFVKMLGARVEPQVRIGALVFICRVAIDDAILEDSCLASIEDILDLGVCMTGKCDLIAPSERILLTDCLCLAKSAKEVRISAGRVLTPRIHECHWHGDDGEEHHQQDQLD